MLNAAELIRPDCVLIDFTGRRTEPAEIQNRKQFLKQQIHTAFAGDTVGRTVFIDTNLFEWVVPSILALWEMGCSIFVHDLNSAFTRIPEFAGFYDFIDTAVVDTDDFNKFNITVPLIDLRQYRNRNYTFDTDVTVPDTTVAVKTHTSGTTGAPKIIDFDHRYVIARIISITPFHGYSDADRPFHFKTFHHGALFLDYALPLLYATQEHYFLPTMRYLSGNTYNARDFLNLVMPYIQQNKLTTMMMPYEWINYFDQARPVDTEGRLSIRTLRGYDARIANWVFENIRPKNIVNQFGCSELGTMFISRVTQDNVADYDPKRFHERAPDVEFVFESNLVHAKRTGYEWYTLADSFVDTGDELYYNGRSYNFVVDGETVVIQDLENYLRTQYHPTQFQLVPDFLTSKLYLALFDASLDTDLTVVNNGIAASVSPKHCVTDARYFHLPDVQTGIKPSGQILLYAFTKDQNDIQSH
jgi:hypothetical protein